MRGPAVRTSRTAGIPDFLGRALTWVALFACAAVAFAALGLIALLAWRLHP